MVGRTVILDAGPLGLVTNPKRSPQSAACAKWLQGLLAGGFRVIVPEISDYEIRRELLRARKEQGRPTADDKALDADVILAAQAVQLGEMDILIATTNVGHLSRFAAAALWPDIISR